MGFFYPLKNSEWWSVARSLCIYFHTGNKWNLFLLAAALSSVGGGGVVVGLIHT